MHEGPHQPRRHAGEGELAEVGHGVTAADDGELPLVPVGEGDARLAGEVVLMAAAAYCPIWIATGQTPGSGPLEPRLMQEGGGITQDEELGMARHGAVGLDEGAPLTVERRVEGLEQRRGLIAGGPDHGGGRDHPTGGLDRGGGDLGHQRVLAHLDAESRGGRPWRVPRARVDRRAAAAGRPRPASPSPRADRCAGSRARAQSGGSRRSPRPSRHRSARRPPPRRSGTGAAWRDRAPARRARRPAGCAGECRAHPRRS